MTVLFSRAAAMFFKLNGKNHFLITKIVKACMVAVSKTVFANDCQVCEGLEMMFLYRIQETAVGSK